MTNSLGIVLMTTTQVRVLRPLTMSGAGVRGAPITIVENMYVTNIDPVGNDTIQRFMMDTPVNMYECQTGIDELVEVGHTLYEHLTGRTYSVRFVREWPGSHKELVLEFVRPSNV